MIFILRFEQLCCLFSDLNWFGLGSLGCVAVRPDLVFSHSTYVLMQVIRSCS